MRTGDDGQGAPRGAPRVRGRPAARAVEIPIRHMAVTGQTQEAGKTTALEALIARSGLRAVTFVTKRGEGSFAAGRDDRSVLSRAGRLAVRRLDPRSEPRREAEVRTRVDHPRQQGRPDARGRAAERPQAHGEGQGHERRRVPGARRVPRRASCRRSRAVQWAPRGRARRRRQRDGPAGVPPRCSTWSSSRRSIGCSSTRRTPSSSCPRPGSSSRRAAARR